MLMSTPGIEDFQVEPAKQEATVRFDRRRVTVDELAALLVTSGLAASPRDWGGR
jgi:copper chaperone CopZ